MRIDKETNRVFVRQSWLKDMLLCPERARLAVVQPEFKTQNDSAAIGTAVHAGIEAVLAKGVSVKDAPEISLIKFKELESVGVNHTNVNPDSWHNHVLGLTEAWVKDIYPKVPIGGNSEVPFAVPTNTLVNGMELWFEGTMDYLHENGIWDWKTAARKYSVLEKQTQDIQSSIYSYAGAKLGVLRGDSVFKFGVMVRVNNHYGQIVSVNRTKAHFDFVIKQAASAVATACAMMKDKDSPTDERWLINDQHYLCSQRWCPWWSICKGAHISEPDNEIGDNNG
jgi:hypothetical protein